MCKNCIFWQRHEEYNEHWRGRGECHRYPPQRNQHSGDYHFSQSREDDWCGEYNGGME